MEIVQEVSSFGIASMEPFCRRILITRVMSMLLQHPQVITGCFLQALMDRLFYISSLVVHLDHKILNLLLLRSGIISVV